MDIEFGKLKQATPQSGLRPDLDGQLLVANIGEIQAQDLRIYVDLDVMREMEAHAISNTRVELGGVLLGYQRIDREGKPYVVIADCLRAEHYQATKGSFKFTHETWSQITRDRAKFRPELEMVGWYHTHPGWSVFLSGMDLFICDHFFNRPLDVALVIDPCAHDRGWFYWSGATAGGRSDQPDEHELEPEPVTANERANQPRRAGGFFLTTGRFRAQELFHFANLYNRQPDMNHDPRYPQSSFSGQTIAPGSALMQMNDQRKLLFDVALASMLMMQLLLMGLIAWRLLGIEPTAAPQQKVVALQSRLTEFETELQNRIAREAQQEILQMMVASRAGEPGFVERFTELKTALNENQSNLSAQIAVTEKLKSQTAVLQQEIELKNSRIDRLGSQLLAAQREAQDARRTLGESRAVPGVSETGDQSLLAAAGEKKLDIPGWLAIVSGLGVLGIGGAAGFLFGRMNWLREKIESNGFANDEEDKG